MLFTLLLIIPSVLASVLFLYVTTGTLIHLYHLYMDGRTRRSHI